MIFFIYSTIKTLYTYIASSGLTKRKVCILVRLLP